MRHHVRRSIVACAVAAAACGGTIDLPLSPTASDPAVEYGVVRDTAGAPIRPLIREHVVTHPQSWSFLATPAGVLARDRANGLTIRVPAGAVADTVTITVTAVEGGALAYDFAPHGLRFSVPLEITQDLHGVTKHAFSTSRTLLAGYFAHDRLGIDKKTGIACVHELIPVRVGDRGRTVTFDVRHFSGYTVASAVHGRRPDESDPDAVPQ